MTIIDTISEKFESFDGAMLGVDIYIDKDADKTRKNPCIVWFFGGGWSHGSHKNNFPYGKYFAANGFVVVSPYYRTSGADGTTPYESVKDSKRAVQWVYDNADKYLIDKDKIIVAGGSAGAHVASCCTHLDPIDADDIDTSFIPKAQILINPVLDTTKNGYHRERDKDIDMDRLSPVHHLKKGVPPTILFHGTADKTVSYNQSAQYFAKMTELGNTVYLHSYPDEGHGFAVYHSNLKNFADVILKTENFLNNLGFGKENNN